MDNGLSKYLYDILDSIQIIEAHLLYIKTFSEYKDDLKTMDAVERRLSIIGEALNKATKIDSNLKVTDVRKIIGLRHILIHDYDLADKATIWIIFQKHLPILKTEIEIILKQSDGSTSN